jgi:hypothetical protein
MFALRVLNDLAGRADLFDDAIADEGNTVRDVTGETDFMVTTSMVLPSSPCSRRVSSAEVTSSNSM